MILNLTTEEASALYKKIGGKDQFDSELNNVIDGSVNLNVLTEDEQILVNTVLEKLTAKRQQEDRRLDSRLSKLIDDLEATGFEEEKLAELKKTRDDAAIHNLKKYPSAKSKSK